MDKPRHEKKQEVKKFSEFWAETRAQMRADWEAQTEARLETDARCLSDYHKLDEIVSFVLYTAFFALGIYLLIFCE